MSKKILVTDDELDIQTLVKITLEKSGYQVSTASNGVEALKKAESELPDLILLDVVMPGKGGWEVCKILKSQEKTKQIPIIIFTVLSRSFGEKYEEYSKPNDYLQKPFTAQELLSKVKQYVGE